MTPPLDDVRDVAAYLRVSEKFVRRHALELGGVKVGPFLRFDRAEVARYLEGRRLDRRISP